MYGSTTRIASTNIDRLLLHQMCVCDIWCPFYRVFIASDELPSMDVLHVVVILSVKCISNRLKGHVCMCNSTVPFKQCFTCCIWSR
jgi:hypothetical protein